MYGTDSIIGQQAQYPIENGIPSLHRDVLEDDEGVSEIEFSFDGQEIVAFDESGVCNSKALAVAFRFPQHGRGNVGTNYGLGTPGERNRKTAHAAPEVKDPSRRDRPVQCFNLLGQIMNDNFSRLEKFVRGVIAESFSGAYAVVGPSLADQFSIRISICHVSNLLIYRAYSKIWRGSDIACRVHGKPHGGTRPLSD
jgi:hypothetical protein